MNDPLTLPSDFRLRSVEIQADYLRKDYDNLRRLTYLHEQELMLLSLSICAILLLGTYRLRKMSREIQSLKSSKD